jgi:hypothetical protein
MTASRNPTGNLYAAKPGIGSRVSRQSFNFTPPWAFFRYGRVLEATFDGFSVNRMFKPAIQARKAA